MGRGGLPSACNPSFFSVAGLGEPDGWRGKPPATAVQRHASLRVQRVHVALGLRARPRSAARCPPRSQVQAVEAGETRNRVQEFSELHSIVLPGEGDAAGLTLQGLTSTAGQGTSVRAAGAVRAACLSVCVRTVYPSPLRGLRSRR